MSILKWHLITENDCSFYRSLFGLGMLQVGKTCGSLIS